MRVEDAGRMQCRGERKGCGTPREATLAMTVWPARLACYGDLARESFVTNVWRHSISTQVARELLVLCTVPLWTVVLVALLRLLVPVWCHGPPRATTRRGLEAVARIYACVPKRKGRGSVKRTALCLRMELDEFG